MLQEPASSRKELHRRPPRCPSPSPLLPPQVTQLHPITCAHPPHAHAGVNKASYTPVPLQPADVCMVAINSPGAPVNVMQLTSERLEPALEWGCVLVEWRCGLPARSHVMMAWMVNVQQDVMAWMAWMVLHTVAVLRSVTVPAGARQRPSR